MKTTAQDGPGTIFSRGVATLVSPPSSVTYVLGINRYPCVRYRPSRKWLLRLDSNQQPSG